MLSRICFSLLAAAGFLPLLGAAPAAADAASRISLPVAHENVAAYFIHGPSSPGPVPQTLQEALAKGTVEVSETGTVRELQIENRGDEPVFVQFGDLVKGGRQDRVLTVSMVLPPKSGKLPIGAYCVEQGRWSARGKEDAAKFSLSEALMPSREAKMAMAKPNVAAAAPAQENAARESAPRDVTVERQTANRTVGGARQTGGDGQGEVWRSVGVMQNLLSATVAEPIASEKSRTSLQLALENEKLKQSVDNYVSALEPAGLKGDDIVGVVIAVNGRISSADVYPSNGLFRKMWPKLVRAGVTEALAAKGAEVAAAPAPDAVGAFLKDAENGKASQLTLGTTTKLESRDADKAIRMEARTAAGALVHRNYLAK